MRTYTKEQAVKRNVEMLDAALSRPSFKCNGSAEKMSSIFKEMFLADKNKNKRCGDQSNFN